MRTQEEIINLINFIEQSNSDWLGFKLKDLVICLTYENAKKKNFIEYGVSEKDWIQYPHSYNYLFERIKDYMEFAWDKANNCQGISSRRTIDHIEIWLWLMGFDVNLSNYNYYGKPQLRTICEFFNIDWKQYDSGKWVQNEGETPKQAKDVPDAKLNF